MRRLLAPCLLVLALAMSCDDGGVRDDGGAHDDGGSDVALDGGARDPHDGGATSDAGHDDAGASMTDGGTPPSCAGLSRYVALGSSSTAGAGASDATSTGYVALLTAAMRQSSPDLVLDNKGAGGARIDRFLDALDDIVATPPDVITVLPFTDIVQTPVATLESGYTSFVQTVAALDAQTFIGVLAIDPQLVCGVGEGPGGCYGQGDVDLVASKRAVLEAVAAPYGNVHLVDVLDANVAHPEYNAPDGHPNDLGHRYIAHTLWSTMRAVLACPAEIAAPESGQ